MKRKTKGLVAILAAALAGVGLFTATALGGSSPHEPTAAEQAKAPKRIVPSDPEDRLVIGVWRNCKFHTIKLRKQVAEVDLPGGAKGGEQSAVSTQAEVAAQLPPVDPKCDNVAPTQAQVDKMKADVDAEQKAITEKVKAKAKGATTAPTVPPAVSDPPSS